VRGDAVGEVTRSIARTRVHLGVDVLELGVPIRVAGAFPRLAVGLQAEA
jgi:tryptophan synthase alpha subunit